MGTKALVDLHVRSPAFADGERLPERIAPDHKNASPPLAWSKVPSATAEVVLWCEDLDAPGGLFLHWIVTGINPGADTVGEGQVPDAATEGVNSFGGTAGQALSHLAATETTGMCSMSMRWAAQ